MNETQNVLFKEYLSRFIFIYLDIEDILNLSLSNKKIRQILGKTWKEICTNEFIKDYNDYSIFEFFSNYKNPRINSFICDSFFIGKINWEQLFKYGKQIKKIMKNLQYSEITRFNDDCLNFCNYFFSTLKGNFYFFYIFLLIL